MDTQIRDAVCMLLLYAVVRSRVCGSQDPALVRSDFNVCNRCSSPCKRGPAAPMTDITGGSSLLSIIHWPVRAHN